MRNGCKDFPGVGTYLSRSDGSRADRHTWTLVGNAVSVPVVRWLAAALNNQSKSTTSIFLENDQSGTHNAGMGGPKRNSTTFRVVSEGPSNPIYKN